MELKGGASRERDSGRWVGRLPPCPVHETGGRGVVEGQGLQTRRGGSH